MTKTNTKPLHMQDHKIGHVAGHMVKLTCGQGPKTKAFVQRRMANNALAEQLVRAAEAKLNMRLV